MDSLIELTDDERLELSGYCELRELDDGETLYRVNDVADTVWFVAEGMIALCFEGEGWFEVIGKLGPQSTVGGAALLFDGPRSTNARAVGPTVVWGFRRDIFKQLRDANMQLAHRLVHELTRQTCADLRAVNARIEARLQALDAPVPSHDEPFAAESEWWEPTSARRHAISRLWHSDLD